MSADVTPEIVGDSPLVLSVYAVKITRTVLVLAEHEDEARSIAEDDLCDIDPNDYEIADVDEVCEIRKSDKHALKLVPYRAGGTHETRTVAELVKAGEADL